MHPQYVPYAPALHGHIQMSVQPGQSIPPVTVYPAYCRSSPASYPL